ncbi:MAG: asparagine synthase (glutamine-hydrolyzing) [Bryobacteraceae bacterium]
MCGIAGFVTEETVRPDRPLLKRMCDRIAHRGPDDYGEWTDNRAALGHRRLSIIDLAGGHQPLGNEDGTVQVVFNGEIYNYLELSKDLMAKGHRFATHSDTETLVHLWEEVGERMPEYLNGMFAFAIWDQKKQQLFLARDRFGKKPLYYTQSIPGMRIAFGSELKALTAAPGFPFGADARAVADFLCFGYVPDPETIYDKVKKVGPGCSLLVDLRSGKQNLRQYWQLEFHPEAKRKWDDAVEEIRALSIDSVRCRLMSEVPLGAFLSGGVDSSTVVAIMAKHAEGLVKSFSIGFTNKRFDETEYARMVAKMYQTEHHEEIVTPSIHETLDTLVDHYDEPFGDSSAIPTLYLCRMTRKHVTVALSGDGGDEILGGYDRYMLGAWENQLRGLFPGWFRRSVLKTAARYYPKYDFMPRPLRWKSMLTCLSQEIADGYFTSVTAFRDEALDAVLSPEMRRTLAGYTPRENFRKHFEGLEHLSALEQMQAVDVKTYLPGDILVKVDRASMAYSLESRSPLLDYRLAEAASKLPPGFKLKGTSGKHIFKEAFSSYLPPVTTSRKKMGFGAPKGDWFKSSLKPTFEALVLRPEMERYLSLGEVRKIWAEHQAGWRDQSVKLWYMLMLACWEGRHNSPATGSNRWYEGALATVGQ